MSRASIVNPWALVAALLCSAALCGDAGAQPEALTVKPKTSGPVDVVDLNVLLPSDLQFQLFDFEAARDFCFVFGYVHEMDGQRQAGPAQNYALCSTAGPQRLVVAMRPIDDQYRLVYGLHNRDTGAGGSMSVTDLPIDKDIGHVSRFKAEDIVDTGRETTLVHWRFQHSPRDAGPRHDVRVLVRLAGNDLGTGSYSVPNERTN